MPHSNLHRGADPTKHDEDHGDFEVRSRLRSQQAPPLRADRPLMNLQAALKKLVDEPGAEYSEGELNIHSPAPDGV